MAMRRTKGLGLSGLILATLGVAADAGAEVGRVPRLAGELVAGAGTPVGAIGGQLVVGLTDRVALAAGLGEGLGRGGLQWAAGGRFHLTPEFYLGATVHGGEWEVLDIMPKGQGGDRYDSVWVGAEVGVRVPVTEHLYLGGTAGLARAVRTECVDAQAGDPSDQERCDQVRDWTLPHVGLSIGFAL